MNRKMSRTHVGFKRGHNGSNQSILMVQGNKKYIQHISNQLKNYKPSPPPLEEKIISKSNGSSETSEDDIDDRRGKEISTQPALPQLEQPAENYQEVKKPVFKQSLIQKIFSQNEEITLKQHKLQRIESPNRQHDTSYSRDHFGTLEPYISEYINPSSTSKYGPTGLSPQAYQKKARNLKRMKQIRHQLEERKNVSNIQIEFKGKEQARAQKKDP